MDNLKTNIEPSAEMTAGRSEALALHQRILVNANTAVACWTETCKDLKQMRDAKMYIALGYETFSDYTEQALGIKERQAYTYIQALEKLGSAFLQSNADIGITKLSLLTAVPVTERQDIIDNNDIAGMTVAEVKALVAENDGKGEQISMLTEQVDALRDEAAEKEKDIGYAEQRIAELEEELAHERSKPVEVAVEQPSDEMLTEIRSAAEETARKEFAAEKKELKKKAAEAKEKAVADATEQAKKEIEEYKQQLAALDAANKDAIDRAADLEKRLAVSSSPETVKFTFYFDSLQSDYAKLIESISKIKADNPEVAEKYAAALRKYHDMISAQISAN